MRRRISIRGRVRPSVGPYVRPVLFSKVKSTHTRRIFCRVSGLVKFLIDFFSYRQAKKMEQAAKSDDVFVESPPNGASHINGNGNGKLQE